MITPDVIEFFVDEFIFTGNKRAKAFFVRAFECHHLFWRQSLGANFGVAHRVAVKTSVQLRIEPVIIFGARPRKFRNRFEFVQVRLERHRLQPHAHSGIEQQIQPAHKSVERAGLARDRFVCFACDAVDGDFNIAWRIFFE